MSINFSTEMLETITSIILKTITKENRKKAKENKDWRLRNTTLLLRNYHILKEHCIDIENELIMYNPIQFDTGEIQIDAIVKSKEKTRMMVAYIDSMLDAYERYSIKEGEAARRRYKALYYYYVSDSKLGYADLSELLNIHERTVRKDIEEARKEFSVFLFGILSLEDIAE